MLVAGWQFGIGGTEAPFSSTEVALEKAIAGSGYMGVVIMEFVVRGIQEYVSIPLGKLLQNLYGMVVMKLAFNLPPLQ